MSWVSGRAAVVVMVVTVGRRTWSRHGTHYDDLEMLVRVLGPFTAQSASGAIDVGGPRQRAVLALLLSTRGEVVSVDRLIEDLWRGEAPPRAIASLQAYVSNLRRALEPDREPRAPARLLVSAPPG